ncbi:hypothetical protein H0H93_003963 [Arthromyces matolae]|nr:hypothetical protein H0H93_003963 [Arthromyces matolae]
MGYTCKDLSRNAAKHIQHRLVAPFELFPFSALPFLDFLEKHNSVVFGSKVTMVLLEEPNEIREVDVCVPFSNAGAVVSEIEQLMKGVTTSISDAYPKTIFRQVYAIAAHDVKMKIFVSATNNVIHTVLNSPATALMNYITGSHFYSAYPKLTFSRQFMVNIGSVFHEDPDFDVNHFASKIVRLETQGFTMVADCRDEHDVCGEGANCPWTVRGYKDSDGWALVVRKYTGRRQRSLTWAARNTQWSLLRGSRD